MILKQKDYPTESPQDLPANDDIVDTGEMGGCSSVIFLWNPDKSGKFADVRGYHGGGGLSAVNWPAMRAGVLDNQTTQVFVVASPENGTVYERKRAKQFIKDEILKFLKQAHCTTHQGVTRATITRNGKIQILGFIDLKLPDQTWG